MNVIEVSNLSKKYKVAIRESGLKNALKSFLKKKYKEVKAVDNISFKIKKGEIVGYIGPNGAGKSTTIKMLTGILKPNEGKIVSLGMDPSIDRVEYVKNIGVVFGQKSQLWWDIPAEDSFDLLKEIYKIPDKLYDDNKNELVKILKLEEIIKKPVRQLSLGERMKCELVASLLHNPEILFLDEPTIGLDAVSKVTVRNFIKEINKRRNVTIILTTHDMVDIESLTDRLIIIGKGKMLYDGSMKDIKKKYQTSKIIEIYYKRISSIPKIKNAQIVENNAGVIKIKIDSRVVSSSKIIEEYSKVCDITDVNMYEENIDDIICKLYEELNVWGFILQNLNWD